MDWSSGWKLVSVEVAGLFLGTVEKGAVIIDPPSNCISLAGIRMSFCREFLKLIHLYYF